MNVLIKPKNIQQFCTVCFQSTSDLIPCMTQLFIEDTSYSVIDILNLLTSQQTIMDSGPYPKGICSTCKAQVDTTLHLKIKYEKTLQLLKTWLSSHEFKTEDDLIENIEVDTHDNTLGFGDCDEENLVNDNSLISSTGKKNLKFKRNKAHQSSFRQTLPKKKQTYYCLTQTSFNHICPFCLVDLPNALEVRKHALTHKTLKKYLKCQKVSDKVRFYSTQRESKTIFSREKILHKCVHCIKELPVENFWKHTFQHKQSEYACSKCDRVFRKQNHLNSHITYSHLKEFPYQCDVCGKKFVIKDNYDAHLLLHIKPDVLPYACDKCNQTFISKKHLYYHNFKHTDFGSFSAKYKTHRCKICLRTFENANDLQDHRFQIHKKKKKVPIKINANGLFNCELCSKTFSNITALKQHSRNTHKPKSLCSLCGASVLNLKQHMISHEDKRDPLECHICHRMLASKLTLSRHIRVHTGEKPYKCSFCDKTFKDHYPMRVHERIHKGIKKHLCNICGKGFLEKSYMLKHLRKVHDK